MANATVQHFRFRNDDGSESTATWIAGEDASITIAKPAVDTNIRLRFAIDADGGGTASFGLFVSRNAGAPAAVGAASTYVKGVVTANLTNGNPTSNQLTVPPGDTYVIKNGCVSATNATSSSLVFVALDDTEVELSLILTAADLAAGDTLDFTLRIVVSASVAAVQFPSSVRITIASGAGGEDHALESYGPTLMAATAANRITLPWGAPQQDELKFVLLGEEEYGSLRLLPPIQNAQTFFRPFIGDTGEMAGAAADFALIARLKDWIQVQNANFWCACRVQCNAAFRLNLVGRLDSEVGASYILKQTSSTTVTVDGAAAGYTEEVDIDIPWPSIGRLEVWAPAGTLYNSDVRMYYRHRKG